MHLEKNKKILIYCFILIFLGSINNKYLDNIQIFQIKNFELIGLDQQEKLDLLDQLEEIKNQNIFLISKEKIIQILNSNNLIESFFIIKKYPSKLNIVIKKTSYLANMNIEEKNYLIGSNKKLIKTEFIYQDLPIVFGNPSVDDFFILKKDISNSSINFEEIDKLYFFKSKRWDLKLKNGILIKLPIKNLIEALNNYSHAIELPQFDNVKIFDMRIKKQVIINEL